MGCKKLHGRSYLVAPPIHLWFVGLFGAHDYWGALSLFAQAEMLVKGSVIGQGKRGYGELVSRVGCPIRCMKHAS